jgi:beta-lactamase superfamily II metal-dependent hydrolase
VSSELHVIDVGHGNCAVVTGNDWAMMVDAGASAAVIETVIHLGLTRLNSIVISHRDFDHARGLVQLLARESLEIGAVYIGADAAKNPSAPETANLLVALADAKRGGRCTVSRDLDNTFASTELSGGGVVVEVIAPTFATVMTGPTGRSPAGPKMTSNSVSAVLRVVLPDGLRILLPGDMDHVALKELIEAGVDLTADVLVFPHHGSLGTVPDERAFAADVMRAVNAATVLFSVGRAIKARPTADVLSGVLDVRPDVKIACTQLSSGCLGMGSDLPESPTQLGHLTALPAAGRSTCRACAGSITLRRPGMVGPVAAEHEKYLLATASTPMCRTLRPEVG